MFQSEKKINTKLIILKDIILLTKYSNNRSTVHSVHWCVDKLKIFCRYVSGVIEFSFFFVKIL